MLSMIFVNDIAGVSPQIVPGWLRHFDAGGNGMTFVDLVFPAFLFIVGMSIPIAMGARLAKGESVLQSMFHILTRTLSLLMIGVLMVNGSPGSDRMGWSSVLWSTFMYTCAILAFCTIHPVSSPDSAAHRARVFHQVSALIRILGLISLVGLAFAYRGRDGHRIITLSPFSIHTEWYGILGLIGWAYLVAALVFLIFRGQRTALLGCMVLLFCLYPADRTDAFANFWLARYVGIGSTLGSQAAITVAGVLLGSILCAPDMKSERLRSEFTLLFVAGCSWGAWLLHGLYGINKNSATPSWCLWACAITAAIWLGFHFCCDVHPSELSRPFRLAGQNVLLAYLLSNLMVPALELFHLDRWYARLAEANLVCAVSRSLGCAIVLLALTVLLNRIGFRLKL